MIPRKVAKNYLYDCLSRVSGGDPGIMLTFGSFEDVFPAQAGVIPNIEQAIAFTGRLSRASGGGSL